MTFVHRSDAGGVAVLRLDRPPANAIDLPVTEAIDAALAELERAPPRLGLIVTGTGASFSAGVDFKAVPGYDTAQRRAMVANINRMVARLYGFPKPVAAAVNGHAMGGGLVMMLACDRRIAARGAAKLGLAEVRAGIPYPAAPLAVVRDALGPDALRALALQGEVIDPATALAWRVVDELTEPAALMDRASAAVRELAALPGFAAVKAQLRAPALAAMRRAIELRDDPLLAKWV